MVTAPNKKGKKDKIQLESQQCKNIFITIIPICDNVCAVWKIMWIKVMFSIIRREAQRYNIGIHITLLL